MPIRRFRLATSMLGLAVASAAWAAPLSVPHDPGNNPLDPFGPFATVYFPRNVPAPADRVGPKRWTHAYGGPNHNAAFAVSAHAPAWIRKGVSWNFPEARAWPLTDKRPFGARIYGVKEALPVQTQFYGNALGVSVVGGVVYAESDDTFAYAVNARTGRLIWRASPVGNNLMGNPLVNANRVYLSAGSVSFNFANVTLYARDPHAAGRGKDIDYNGVYCLNAHNGKLLWYFPTAGDAMPTPAYAYGSLYISTGDGNIYAISARTGHKRWMTHVGGIANMSSPAAWHHRVFVSMSVIPDLYALDARTGRVLWKASIPGAANTGMGDVSPAVRHGIVVMDAVADPRLVDGHPTLTTIVRAYNARTGKVLWTHNMGRGHKVPAFKGGVPMIIHGMVYVGSPITSDYEAINARTGHVAWTWHVPNAGPAGAGRGAPTYYQGVLYISTGPDVYALNPKTGQVLGHRHIGGRFGIVSPTIVGGTIYLGNSWDWINALPVKSVNPHFQVRP